MVNKREQMLYSTHYSRLIASPLFAQTKLQVNHQ